MVELTARLEKEAGDLAEKHALGGFDAIHLASALTISAIPVVVATWDGRLHQAAQATGLATMPGRL
jgi:predicted nucleic acid-binding protein